MVLGGDYVPAGFRLPRCAWDLLIEHISHRSGLGCPDELLFLLREIACKSRDAIWLQPNTSVAKLDVGEDVRWRKFLLQALRCFVVVGCKRRQVHKASHARVGTGCCYDRSAIRMADQYRGLVNAPQSSSDICDILRMRIQTVLRRDDLKTFGL